MTITPPAIFFSLLQYESKTVKTVETCCRVESIVRHCSKQILRKNPFVYMYISRRLRTHSITDTKIDILDSNKSVQGFSFTQ